MMQTNAPSVDDYEQLATLPDYEIVAAEFDDRVDVFATLDDGSPKGLLFTVPLRETPNGLKIDISEVYSGTGVSIGTVAWDVLGELGYPIIEESAREL